MSNIFNDNCSDDNYPMIFAPDNQSVQVPPAGMPQTIMYVNQSDVLAAQQLVAQQAAENRDLANVNYYLSIDNAKYHSAVDDLKRQNETLRRDRRKKVTSISVMVDEKSGLICLLRHYDNGDAAPEQLITNCKGPMVLFMMKGLDFDLPKEYVLIAIGEQKHIVLERKKLFRGNYLYNTFLAAGIQFNDKIKDSEIQKGLSNYFASQFHNPSEWGVKACSGWHGFNFWTKERHPSFTFAEGAEADFPFLKKSLGNVALTSERINGYFSELRQFKNWRDRAMMLLYPFLGLLFTLLQEYHKYQDFYLNLIADEEFPSNLVASWFQIYNRDSLSVIEPPQTKKRFDDLLLTICDDVLLLDVRGYNGENQYSKSKNEAFANRVAHIVNHRAPLENGKKLRAAVVLLSGKYRSGNVINLVLPSAREGISWAKHEQYLTFHCFESILLGLIVYIQNHVETVRQLLRKKRDMDRRAEVLQTAMDVVEVFFRDEGYSIREELDLPENIDFTTFFADGEDDNSTAVANLVGRLRGQMGNYIAYPKQSNAVFDVNNLYYDDEWVYFPCQLLRAMFQDLHRDQLLQRALLDLREAGDLWTDAANLSVKKVQLGGVRTNFYVVRRKALNPIGCTDIIALTKEDGEVC